MPSDESKCDVEKCVNFSKNFCSCLFSHIGLSGLVVAYTILGGFVFYQIEVSLERSIKKEMQEMKNSTEKKLMNLLTPENMINLNSSEKLSSIQDILNEHEKVLMESIFDKGFNGRYDIDDINWSYEGSILYSVTVITTIGYGHVTPKTKLGRVITIFYALFGIPLTILYLNNIGDYLAQIFRLVYSQICHPLCSRLSSRKKRTKRKRTLNVTQISNGSSTQIKLMNGHFDDIYPDFVTNSSKKISQSLSEPLLSIENVKINSWTDLETIQSKLERSKETQIQNFDIQSFMGEVPIGSVNTVNQNAQSQYSMISETVPLSLTVFIMVVYIAMGAFLFTFWGNEQDYLKWSYFCFITLSTIGFGDIVPGTTVNDNNPKEKLIVSILYVAIGLPVFAMCFKLMEDEIINKIKSLARKIGIVKT